MDEAGQHASGHGTGQKKGRPRHGGGHQFSLAVGLRVREAWGLLPDYAVDCCCACEVLDAQQVGAGAVGAEVYLNGVQCRRTGTV